MRRAKRQEGVVLLLILLLVIMFTGLGLLAVRHTQGELYSAGAYLDNVQAVAVAESAIAMLATDLKENIGRTCTDNVSYVNQFYVNTGTEETNIPLRFSPGFQTNEDCAIGAGNVPDAELRGASPVDTHSALTYPYANVTVFLDRRPQEAAPPAGYSNDTQNNSMGWYYFDIVSEAFYGTNQAISQDSLYTRGHARMRARAKIGPISRLSQK